MGKQPQNIQEEITQITDEFRVMHARINGETHTQASRAEGKHYSHKMQRQALTRWNCKTLDEYKAKHANALRATMFQIRDHATKADPTTHWYEQLIIAHEMFRLMHEQTPMFDKHMRDATAPTVPQFQGP